MRYFSILIIVMMMLSCNATTKKTEFSELYPDNYNASIRWKRFDNIKPFLDADDYKALDKIKKKYKDSTINSYKLILIKKISKDKNKVIIEREEVLLPSNTLVTNKYIQYWIYDSKTKTWKIESEVNDLEE